MAQFYVEAFGKLDRDIGVVPLNLDDGTEDLLSVFDSLGETMGWSGHGGTDRPPLWELHEGESTPGRDDHCIGWINVSVNFGPRVQSKPMPPPPRGGLRYESAGWHKRSWDPARVMPPLIRCFHDALSRFGAVELTGIQVFGLGFDPRVDHFSPDPNWFNINPAERVHAIVTFDEGLLGGPAEPQTVAEALTATDGQFKFGPLVELPREDPIARKRDQWPFMMSVSPHEKGLAATLPEWTPTAIGYALGQVTELAARIDPTPENFVVGITRLPPTPNS